MTDKEFEAKMDKERMEMNAFGDTSKLTVIYERLEEMWREMRKLGRAGRE